MITTIILPALLSSLLLGNTLFAAPGGGLIADSTAGTTVKTQDQILAITNGTARGTNLLHSFQEFNVETDQTADFQAAPDTQHIISRVTGSNDSWIDGQIKSTTSHADMYLVNPNGIVMGENANLDVQGAFHATTANYITLADGQHVYVDPDQGVTLTVAAPEAFGFLDADIGTIRIDGSQQSVAEGQTISLVGGEISTTSGATFETSGGYINLVGLGSVGEARLSSDRIDTTSATQANITFTESDIIVDNQSDSHMIGKIQILGQHITISDSAFWADNNSVFDATGYSVDLQANTIQITDSEITAMANSRGQGGSVRLTANDQVRIDDGFITTETTSEADDAGAGGNLVIQAADITLENDTLITTMTYNNGQGGAVQLEAANQVLMNNSFIDISTFSIIANAGNSGNLTIRATDITLENEAAISAGTLSTGRGGTIQLAASGQIQLSGHNTQISSSSYSLGVAGSTRIQAANLVLTEGAKIRSASGFVHLDQDFGEALTDAAGLIAIDLSDSLSMSNKSEISTSATGSRHAGDILIGIVNRPAVLSMTDGARITSGSESGATDAGNAGHLAILTSEQIQMHGGSILTTESENAGGGSIRVETRDLLHLQGSQIITSVKGGAGKGGDIQIDPVFVILENSQIQANAHGGAGGNITLVADYLLRSGPSIIEASSALSTSGEIAAQAVDVDAGSLQAITQIVPLNITQWQPVPCHLRRGRTSRLAMVGYDAHPTAVDDVLSALPLYTLWLSWPQ
ncbi:MAG: filamentous hemagglutinin N-terminal domain-containing protein [Pseudomonadota bacterium]